MTTTHRRVIGAGIAATALAAFVASGPAVAAKKPDTKGNPNLTSVQLLSFNDYHGHLEANDPNLAADVDPATTPVGGAQNLATKLAELRAKARRRER